MKVLISACVFGHDVRWNGKNKLSDDIKEWACKMKIELVPVCPEHELFGTPRRPIRLEDYDGEARAIMGNYAIGFDSHRKPDLRVEDGIIYLNDEPDDEGRRQKIEEEYGWY